MHSVHFLIMYNKLSQTYCISSQQAIPYANADAKMHPDRGVPTTGAQMALL